MATLSGHQPATGGGNPHPQPPPPAQPRPPHANQVLPAVAAPPARRKRRRFSWLCCGDYGRGAAIWGCLAALLTLALWLYDRFNPQDDGGTAYSKGTYEEARHQSDVETKRLCIEMKEAQVPSLHMDCDRILASPFPTRHEVVESTVDQILRAPSKILSGLLTVLVLVRDSLLQNSFTGVVAICVLAVLGAWLFTRRTPPYEARYSQSTKSEAFDYTPSGSTHARSSHNHRHQGGDPSSDSRTAVAFSTQTRVSRTKGDMRLPATAESAHAVRDENRIPINAAASSSVSHRLTSSTSGARRTWQSDQMLSSGSAASSVGQQTARSPTSALPSPEPDQTIASTTMGASPPVSIMVVTVQQPRRE